MPVGCATHSYTITDRSGGLVVADATLLEVEYNRLLNDSSDATVTLAVSSGLNCPELGGIRSWRHKLNIYRNSDFMWSGFITQVQWHLDRVVVTATDLIGLLDRRVPHAAMTFKDTDLTVIASELVADALQLDDPGHEIRIASPADAYGGRTYEKWVGQTGDHLRDLSDTGIDFTAIGQTVVLMGDTYCEVVGRLSDDDMPDGLVVAEDGTKLATRQIVAGSEQNSAVGRAGGIDDYYGLLELYTEQTTISDQPSADAAAQAKLNGALGVPVYIDTQNVTLAPTANVDVAQLVPGWCLDITSDRTCRRITQRLKITGLKITEDGGSNDDPGQEHVTVQVAATGGGLNVKEEG